MDNRVFNCLNNQAELVDVTLRLGSPGYQRNRIHDFDLNLSNSDSHLDQAMQYRTYGIGAISRENNIGYNIFANNNSSGYQGHYNYYNYYNNQRGIYLGHNQHLQINYASNNNIINNYNNGGGVTGGAIGQSASGHRPTGRVQSRANIKGKNKNNNIDDVNRRCSNSDCGTMTTPMWRKGPLGPKTLCNACGIKYRKREEKRQAEANR